MAALSPFNGGFPDELRGRKKPESSGDSTRALKKTILLTLTSERNPCKEKPHNIL